MAPSPHPAATHHLPWFVTAPGDTDTLLAITALIVVAAVFGIGLLFLRLHSLPERLGHKKLQFEIVAVLGLLSLFTHVHLFWVVGLLLALIDFPDFTTPLQRTATALEQLPDRMRTNGRVEPHSSSSDRLAPRALPASPQQTRSDIGPEIGHA